MDEQEMEFLEQHIPEMAQAAVVQAYWAALASGCTVLVAEEGKLIEISPNGTKKIIDSLPLPIPTKIGQKLEFHE